MNEGLNFSHQYESSYNIYRRVLIANPLLMVSKTTAFRHIKTHLKSRLKLKISPNGQAEYEYVVQSKVLPKTHTTSKFVTLEYECKKQCPICSKMVFHSSVYHFHWLVICPIHKIELTQHCPECKKRWPNPHELITRNCECCGVSVNNDNYNLRKNSQEVILKPIKSIFEIVHKIKNFTTYDLLGKNRRSSIDISHFLAPSILNKIGVIDTAIFSDLSVLKIEIRSIDIIKRVCVNDIFENKNYISSDEVNRRRNILFHKIRLKVMRQISLTVRSLTSDHILHAASSWRTENECPYCYAFGTWFRLIFWGQEPELKENLQAIKPEPWPFIEGENILYSAPLKVQMKIYEKDLQMSFVALYHHAIAYYRDRNNRRKSNGALFFEPTMIRNILYTSNLFCNFWIIEYNSKMQFCYSNTPILTPENLAPAPDLSAEKCSFLDQSETANYPDKIIDFCFLDHCDLVENIEPYYPTNHRYSYGKESNVRTNINWSVYYNLDGKVIL